MRHMTARSPTDQLLRTSCAAQTHVLGLPFVAHDVRDRSVARPSDLRRGDIWRVDFGSDIGEHPAVLLSRTGSMRRRWRAVVALITTEAIGLPTEVPAGPEHGLERDSAIDCEDLYSVSSDLLTRRTGELDSLTQDAVDRALRIALGLAF